MGRSSGTPVSRGDKSKKARVNTKVRPSRIRVSVNLRYSKKDEPLLPFDIFCVASTSTTLSELFNRAVKGDPDGSMKKFILRPDKRIIVLCEKEEDNGYTSAGGKCQEIVHMNPVRLIFCVSDMKKSALRSRPKIPTMLINLRQDSDPSGPDLLEEDIEIETPSQWLLSDVWKAVQDWDSKLEKYKALCLSTRRPLDGVALRIALSEQVADVSAVAGKRYIFAVSQLETDDLESESEEESDEDSESETQDEDYFSNTAPRAHRSHRSRNHRTKGHHRK